MNIAWVSNARDWLKMYSNQMFIAIALLGVVQSGLTFIGWLLPWWLSAVLGLLCGAAGIALRLMKQWDIKGELTAAQAWARLNGDQQIASKEQGS